MTLAVCSFPTLIVCAKVVKNESLGLMFGLAVAMA